VVLVIPDRLFGDVYGFGYVLIALMIPATIFSDFDDFGSDF